MSKVKKKIEINKSLCVGCGICELACSFYKVGGFAPSRAAIRVFDNEENEIFPVIARTVHSEDSSSEEPLRGAKSTEGPAKCNACGQCVAWCPTGTLTLVDL